MAVDWAVSTAKKVLAHLDVEAFPHPVAGVIEREILPLLEDWRKGVELVYAATGEASPVGLSCPTLAEKVLAIRSENERLLHLYNRQQDEIQSLTEMADAGEDRHRGEGKGRVSDCHSDAGDQRMTSDDRTVEAEYEQARDRLMRHWSEVAGIIDIAEPTDQDICDLEMLATLAIEQSAELEQLKRDLADSQYWRERHCKESEANGSQSVENWKRAKFFEESVAEALKLLKEWMAEPASFDDERINYVEKQIGRALIRDTADFLKRTEGK